MNGLRLAIGYIPFWLKAKSKYKIHSPFIYELITKCINDNRDFYALEEVKSIGTMLRLDNRVLEYSDPGNPESHNSPKRVEIGRQYAKVKRSAKYNRLVFNLVNYFKPANILELGTSFGLGTLLLSRAGSKARIITVEGVKEIAEIASEFHKEYGIENVKQEIGLFRDILPGLLKSNCFDFVFIDGHHQKAPTLEYFEMILNSHENEMVLLLDDIRWSRGMWEAWNKIIGHPSVTLSLDLYMMGIVFIKPGFTKQQFKLRY